MIKQIDQTTYIMPYTYVKKNHITIPYGMLIPCWLNFVVHSVQTLPFKESPTLSRCVQYERHKKFVGDYILYYGGQMADFKRSV